MKKRKNATTSLITITPTAPLPSDPTASLPAASPVSTQVTPTVSLDDKVIAHRAYAIWQEEGEPVGRDYEHWLRAEAELRASATPSAAGMGASATAARLAGASSTGSTA